LFYIYFYISIIIIIIPVRDIDVHWQKPLAMLVKEILCIWLIPYYYYYYYYYCCCCCCCCCCYL